MPVTMDQLERWLSARENENLEFKHAKNQFPFTELAKYCAALANEGGGHIVLGVTDERPRRVVGSEAFPHPEEQTKDLVARLRIKVEWSVLDSPHGRVVVFSVAARPLGAPVMWDQRYWMRAGDAVVVMTPDRLRDIFAEVEPDFSAEVCERATLDDLDPVAVERFRELWLRRSANAALRRLTALRLLEDAQLACDGRPTFAALILLGSERALARFLAQAEVIYEFRSSDASTAYQAREEYRRGFLLFMDALWAEVDRRNELIHFQDGLFVHNLRAWNEAVVRESILNAICHREYRVQGSVFVRQFPKRLEIVSPGGLPPGVTPANIVFRQAHRNRRIAEALNRCGLVERSGQGADRMFEESIREGKGRPDFAGTDDYQVRVVLHGEILDRLLLRFLERLGQERLRSWSAAEFMAVDLVHRNGRIGEELRASADRLVADGVLERFGGRGRGARLMLSQRYYDLAGRAGEYTRRRGLDRATNKELLVKHVQARSSVGAQLGELNQVLPHLTPAQVQSLVRELKSEGRVLCVGRTKAARWFPGPSRK